jgi:hypothetical protein
LSDSGGGPAYQSRSRKIRHGWSVFGNVERVGPDGTPERLFLQEELFGPEEYQQVVACHYGMGRHNLTKAQTSRDHAKMRYAFQLPLFGEADETRAARSMPPTTDEQTPIRGPAEATRPHKERRDSSECPCSPVALAMRDEHHRK